MPPATGLQSNSITRWTWPVVPLPAQCRNGKELWESITPSWGVSQIHRACCA